MKPRRALLVLACCAALVSSVGPASAQRPDRPAPEPGIRISYKNAPVASVVTDLARATGVSLIYDEKVSELGTVTIEGPPQVNRAEALAMIDSLLLLRGFAALPGPGGVRKIIAISGAPSPWTANAKLPDSDAPVTTLLRLENANATDLVPVLTPYLGANATASAFEPTNSLILSGAASLLRTLRIAIDALDRPEAGAPLIWPLRVARAEKVADQLREIAGDLDVPFVTNDDRLNALVLRVRPGETERIRAVVDELDRPAHGAGRMQVVRLRNADPEQLAEELVELRNDSGGTGTAGAERHVGLRGQPFDVVADRPTRSLVLSGPPEAINAVLDVVSDLDRVPASVRVEITVATVDVDDQMDLSFDFMIPDLANAKGPEDLIAAVFSTPSGRTGIPSGASESVPFVAAFSRAPLLLPIIDPITGKQFAIPEGGALTMNGRTVKSNVMMRPRLLITSGQEHEIFAGNNVPIPVARPSGAGTGTLGTGTTGTTGTTGGGSTSGTATETTANGAIDLGNAAISTTDGTGGTGTTGTGTTGITGTGAEPSLAIQQNIERKDVGTSLRVTPTVGAEGGVILDLRVEVSSIVDSVAGPVESVGPTIQQTTIESTIHLLGGEVAVIATAAQPEVQRDKTGAPWFMDIPVIGWAFKATHDRTVEHHLLVAARAEILRPESRDLADRLARALAPATAQSTH
jgi:general secretion pathway protein D